MAVTLDWSIVFQSTLPHGERPEISNQSSNSRNFNPRSRMGSDHSRAERQCCRRYFNPRSRMGSDPKLVINPPIPEIAIHAPAWEATPAFCELQQIQQFNPRSRMGSDSKLLADYIDTSISIHAPAWGATILAGAEFAYVRFQSTLPHGERQCPTLQYLSGIQNFNPRSRMGSDG